MVGIDTAFNYQRFNSHRHLAHVAGDLLDDFTISTKVGFFPGSDPAACALHSLDPRRLREAVEQSAESLGRVPDVVFLHSPERSLTGRAPEEALDAACITLADAQRAGLCRAWGIATWDPRSLITAPPPTLPSVLLLRSGLSVAHPILTACERLIELCDLPATNVWGMSPFGGDAREAAWQEVDLTDFTPASAPNTDIAFRVAYDLPPVTRVAVGTTNRDHLRSLVAATNLPIIPEAVTTYRGLTREHDR